MAGTFGKRITSLRERVGDGALTGKVIVDQVYAQYQHEGLDLKHPGGGQAKYLEKPLFNEHRDYLNDLADSVLDNSSGVVGAMTRSMEDLSREVYRLAPVEFSDLRASGNPRVLDRGRVVYNRPPLVHRLSAEEIKAKAQLHRLGLGN